MFSGSANRKFVLTGVPLMMVLMILYPRWTGFTAMKVQPKDVISTWPGENTKTAKSPDHPGLVVLRKTGCLVCHSTDGSKLVGPTFKGLYGSMRVEVTPGGLKNILADSIFIRRAVYEPDAEMALGFGKSLMKTYKDIVNESDLKSIIEYLKILCETVKK
jgi:cytochrome c oxidase subunit 2